MGIFSRSSATEIRPDLQAAMDATKTKLMGKSAKIAQDILDEDERIELACFGKDGGDLNKLVIVTDRRLLLVGAVLNSSETTVIDRSQIQGIQTKAHGSMGFGMLVASTPSGSVAFGVMNKYVNDVAKLLR